MKRKVVFLVYIMICIWTMSCSKKDVLKDGCVKAEFVGPSDSPCGGPYKIKILGGFSSLKALYPSHNIEKGYIITTLVPENLRKSGRIMYFTPLAVTPKICTANVNRYIEIQMTNLSGDSCQ